MELLTEKYVREKQERDAENPPEHWGRHPDVYVHKRCGGATQMPEHIRRNYLADPNFYGSDTICSHCGVGVPESQCFWVDTGECLTDYMKRLKKEKSQSTSYQVMRWTPVVLGMMFAVSGVIQIIKEGRDLNLIAVFIIWTLIGAAITWFPIRYVRLFLCRMGWI